MAYRLQRAIKLIQDFAGTKKVTIQVNPTPQLGTREERKHKARTTKRTTRVMVRSTPCDAPTCLGAAEASVRGLGPIGVASQVLRFPVRYQLSQFRCISILFAASSQAFLLFSPCDHKPPPTLRDRLDPHHCLRCLHFPVPRYARRPDVALYVPIPSFSFRSRPLRIAPSWFPSTISFMVTARR